MEADLSKPSDGGSTPSFMYLVGDCVYYNGEVADYYAQYYAEVVPSLVEIEWRSSASVLPCGRLGVANPLESRRRTTNDVSVPQQAE
jgi:hypothetical protein